MPETIKQYRKKPAVVDAIEVNLENLSVITRWCGSVGVEYLGSDSFTLQIPNRATGETFTASFGDFLVKDADQGLRYFSLAEFQETFEAIDESLPEEDEGAEEETVPDEPTDEDPEEGSSV